MSPNRFFASILILLLSAALPASDDLLRATEAFTHKVSIDGDEIVIDWSVEPGYYLYREKIRLSLKNPGNTLGLPLMPRGTDHSDEFFGEQQIYDKSFQVRIPFSGRASANTLTIRSQGCSSAFGICFPPESQDYPLTLTAAGGSLFGDSPFAVESPSSAALSADEAFSPVVTRVAADTVEVGWQIAPGHYLYKSEIQANFDGAGARVIGAELPAGKPKRDEYFGDTEVYYDSVFATFSIARDDTDAGVRKLTLRYQGCEEDGICFNPIETSFDVSLPAGTGVDTSAAAPESKQGKLARLIRDGNLFTVLATFYGLGLLLAFTPCVLPMVPILSGIITGEGESTSASRGFFLALMYVLGMALTYTIAGVIFASFGQQAASAFQQPWIIASFAGLFVVLSLSMFGLFELQMPSGIQTRIATISGNQKGGTAFGAFVMGGLSSLVVTACVAPPLVAALAVISQTGDYVRGGLSLFAMSIGMGTPLLLVGASAGRLLPKAGAWMERVKQGFGFVMLGVAIWMLSRLLPAGVVLLLWAILAVMGGIFLGGMTPLPQSPRGSQQLAKGVGMLTIVYGVIMFVGALTGGEDPLQPMKGSVLASRGGAAAQEHDELRFVRIKTVADLDAAVAAANANGQAVMLDFYADWCVSCKEMEKYTFTDATVVNALKTTVLLQADVTANDQADKALMKRFGIAGPPSIVFFGPDGIERPGYEVVGYMKADEFAPHVLKAIAPSAVNAQR